VDAVRRAYAHFDDELSPQAEAAMRAHLVQNPRGKHGKNPYTLEGYGLDPGEIRERFASYTQRFGVPEES